MVCWKIALCSYKIESKVEMNYNCPLCCLDFEMSEDDLQAAGEQKALIALLSSEPSEPESNLQADVSINVIVAWLLGH